jgi:acetoin utilization deacetylase AcuC-like enzyme
MADLGPTRQSAKKDFCLTALANPECNCIKEVRSLVGVGIVYDEIFLKHDTGSHPENGDRVKHIYNHLKSKPLFDRLTEVRPRRATDDEVLAVHAREYYYYLKSLPTDRMLALDPDTLFGPGSLEAALYAAGAVTTAVDAVLDGPLDRVFCLVRPPGHHALADRAMGFCILNNVAIGAAYAGGKPDLGRSAIIDLDVHHGNGTQHIFYDDADVLYCSVHRSPFYPGTGSSHESGRDGGTGKTVNVPLAGGSGIDEYRRALTQTIIPAVREHGPSLIFLSIGFDAHRSDPIGGMDLTTEAYGELTDIITQTAAVACGGRIVSVLEGGYNLDALAASTQAHLEALTE